MKRIINLVLSLLVALLSQAQPQLTVEQNLEDYDFAVKYIENNYSGFPTKVVDSTRADYESIKTHLRAQVAQGERPGWDAAAEYMAWFNDKHLFIHVAFYNDKNEYIGWTEQYMKKKEIHYEVLMEYRPTALACKVTDRTFLIRFPSCEGNPDMKWIKNSIKLFKKSKCENLVIDIRGNGGGGDSFWLPYWKLLYDHEAYMQEPEYRNTPQNMDYLKAVKWSCASRIISSSLQNPDSEFVGGGLAQSICKKVDRSVKKAALIIDNGVASSGEAMVLEIKATSKRTTIYGNDNTSGCLDFSNVAEIPFKHFDHIFQVPMSRRTGLPETGIDETGIAPDVRIPLPLPAKLTDNIDEWIIWVAKQLEAE